jgi:hypothetical protein
MLSPMIAPQPQALAPIAAITIRLFRICSGISGSGARVWRRQNRIQPKTEALAAKAISPDAHG